MSVTWRRRLTLTFLWLVLPAALGAVGWQVYCWRHPGLTPASRHYLPVNTGLVFSAGDVGYPAAMTQGTVSFCKFRMSWLDDRCLPLPGPALRFVKSHFAISPRRQAAARFVPSPEHVWRAILDRPGAEPQEHLQRVWAPDSLRYVLDDGSYCADNGIVYSPRGKRERLPANSQPSNLVSADPRYLALRRRHDARNRLYVLDRQTGQLITGPSCPWMVWSEGMLFARGDRFLAVPAYGPACVFTRQGTALLTAGKPNTAWRWGEDGSAWTHDARPPQILAWRRGAVALVAPPRVLTADPEVSDLTSMDRRSLFLYGPWGRSLSFTGLSRSLPPAGIAHLAAWDDGRLLAVAETLPITPLRRRILTAWAHYSPGTVHTRYRRLTLYRDGRGIGTFLLPLTRHSIRVTPIHVSPPPSSPRVAIPPVPGLLAARTLALPANQEYLAFTADGRHLAWLLRDDKTLQILTFAVP